MYAIRSYYALHLDDPVGGPEPGDVGPVGARLDPGDGLVGQGDRDRTGRAQEGGGGRRRQVCDGDPVSDRERDARAAQLRRARLQAVDAEGPNERTSYNFV